jgi:hypothetical protein
MDRPRAGTFFAVTSTVRNSVEHGADPNFIVAKEGYDDDASDE